MLPRPKYPYTRVQVQYYGSTYLKGSRLRKAGKRAGWTDPEFRFFGLGWFMRAGDAPPGRWGESRVLLELQQSRLDSWKICRVLRTVAPRHASLKLGGAREQRPRSLLMRWIGKGDYLTGGLLVVQGWSG